jgi:uncharacterized iron-regulated membrane protein
VLAVCCSLPPVNTGDPLTVWQRWVRQPQTVWLRKALFQVHLWSGIGLGLYIFFISVTGSVLVYRNELYVAATNESEAWLVSQLIDLHADLLAGPAGRRVNGLGALAALLSALTGLVIWWPGIKRWRRNLTLRRDVGWKRFNWDLHSTIGFWSSGFIVMLAVSGLYLCIPHQFHALADWLDPPAGNDGLRFVDSALGWLAYSHFGRINGIGLPCSGPGLCDQATKAVWAVFGLAPAVMFVTGVIMWWNRVLRPRWRRAFSSSARSEP